MFELTYDTLDVTEHGEISAASRLFRVGNRRAFSFPNGFVRRVLGLRTTRAILQNHPLALVGFLFGTQDKTRQGPLHFLDVLRIVEPGARGLGLLVLGLDLCSPLLELVQ